MSLSLSNSLSFAWIPLVKLWENILFWLWTHFFAIWGCFSKCSFYKKWFFWQEVYFWDQSWLEQTPQQVFCIFTPFFFMFFNKNIILIFFRKFHKFAKPTWSVVTSILRIMLRMPAILVFTSFGKVDKNSSPIGLGVQSIEHSSAQTQLP